MGTTQQKGLGSGHYPLSSATGKLLFRLRDGIAKSERRDRLVLFPIERDPLAQSSWVAGFLPLLALLFIAVSGADWTGLQEREMFGLWIFSLVTGVLAWSWMETLTKPFPAMVQVDRSTFFYYTGTHPWFVFFPIEPNAAFEWKREIVDGVECDHLAYQAGETRISVAIEHPELLSSMKGFLHGLKQGASAADQTDPFTGPLPVDQAISPGSSGYLHGRMERMFPPGSPVIRKLILGVGLWLFFWGANQGFYEASLCHEALTDPQAESLVRWGSFRWFGKWKSPLFCRFSEVPIIETLRVESSRIASHNGKPIPLVKALRVARQTVAGRRREKIRLAELYLKVFSDKGSCGKGAFFEEARRRWGLLKIEEAVEEDDVSELLGLEENVEPEFQPPIFKEIDALFERGDNYSRQFAADPGDPRFAIIRKGFGEIRAKREYVLPVFWKSSDRTTSFLMQLYDIEEIRTLRGRLLDEGLNNLFGCRLFEFYHSDTENKNEKSLNLLVGYRLEPSPEGTELNTMQDSITMNLTLDLHLHLKAGGNLEGNPEGNPGSGSIPLEGDLSVPCPITSCARFGFQNRPIPFQKNTIRKQAPFSPEGDAFARKLSWELGQILFAGKTQ